MHVTWKLDLGAGSVQRLGRTGAQPFCKAPLESGDENVRVEVLDADGKSVFTRRIFASFDQSVVRAHLPAEIALRSDKFQIRFVAVASGKLLAEGAL